MSEHVGRWTKATVYPDMWVNPNEDPRNSEGGSPEGELATLKDYLHNYRLTLRLKCEDLDAEQAATDAVLAEHSDLGERLGTDGIAARELLIHQIEEYARHCGHADLLRECIDGRVGQ